MIALHLRAADLAETSFALSPMQELSFSLRVWVRPQRQPIHLPWRRANVAAWAACDTELLSALVAPSGWQPDFLTPRPDSPITSVDSELDIVAATAPRRIVADIDAAYQGRPLPAVLQDNPRALRKRIVQSLRQYWHEVMEPSWPRIQAVLEADIVYRSRQLALGGARALFAELDERVRWEDGVLFIDRLAGHHHLIEIGGRGLPLVPSIFCRGAVTYIGTEEPPMLVYPARGSATVWQSLPVRTPEALDRLLGSARSRLLVLLRHPATTTELAHQLDVTPSAVSQHLRVLFDAGLVQRARSGRSVLYLRSTLADNLISR